MNFIHFLLKGGTTLKVDGFLSQPKVPGVQFFKN
jgi:hypothetical protein